MSKWLGSRINRQKISDMLDHQISEKAWHIWATSLILLGIVLLGPLLLWLISQHLDFMIGLILTALVVWCVVMAWIEIHTWVKRNL